MISRRGFLLLAISSSLVILLLTASLFGPSGGFRSISAPFRSLTGSLSSSPSRPSGAFGPGRVTAPLSAVVVLAQCCNADISWFSQTLPGVPSVVYSLDGSLDYKTFPTADQQIIALPAGQNMTDKKAGDIPDALALLAYIIDHYDALPDVVVFAKTYSNSWQNTDVAGAGNGRGLPRLNLAYVMDEGLVSLQCEHYPGCDSASTIKLGGNVAVREGDGENESQENNNSNPPIRPGPVAVDPKTVELVWSSIFPKTPLPAVLARPQAAQFAVSKRQIYQVPLAEWLHYRDWIVNPAKYMPPGQSISNVEVSRLFDVLWPFIFFRHGSPNAPYKGANGASTESDGVKCPVVFTCACRGFGICFEDQSALEAWTHLRDDSLGKLVKLMTPESTDQKSDTASVSIVNTVDLYQSLEGEADNIWKPVQEGVSVARQRGESAIWRGLRQAINRQTKSAQSSPSPSDPSFASWSADSLAKLKAWILSVRPLVGTGPPRNANSTEPLNHPVVWPYFSLAEAG